MLIDDVYEGEDFTDFLEHVGVKHRSGRYPEGSGERPYQHCGNFLTRIKELSDSGMTEVEIAKALNFKSTTDFRKAKSIARQDFRSLQVDQAKSLRADGKNTSEIAREMGVNESTVRSWFNKESEDRTNRSRNTADILKEELKTKHVLDVGSGVELELGVSRKTLDDAVARLKDEGYEVRKLRIAQPTNPGKFTTFLTVSDPDIPYRDLYNKPDIIKSVGDYKSEDGGVRWDKREYPASISSKRVAIRYGDQGGADKDGVIEIRPGVKDLDLGKAHYAQVRIMVDGTHYLKGMAMYSDDLPDGVDIMFNTNKKTGTPMMGDAGVLKKIKSDPDNPFGAYIKAGGQSHYIGDDGKEHLSAINKLKEEGDWDKSSKNLSSQFLSKQPIAFINKQLDLTYADYESRFDEINNYTNPTVRRKLLEDFAGECDSAAVTLKAASLPRQQTRVILPVTQLTENEVYAPYLNDGEKVVLVRYPHGGTFEIPRLTVNNKNSEVKKILGNATDAIGINAKVAERLSGADFDGDTVIVIPESSRVRIQTKDPLPQLKGYDPKTEYGTTRKLEVGRDGKEHEVYYNKYGQKVSTMNESNKQNQMGRVSNLITDMTLRGAPDDEIALAVRHSMTVIDAAKHHLDYKQSYKDNRIEYLTNKWQLHYDDEGNLKQGGASTLISRRKRTVELPERRGSGTIDKETGERVYKESGREYINKEGKLVKATTPVSLILNTPDVRKLSSGTLQENAYADFANKMKALANRCRKEYANSKGLEYSPEAYKKYKPQVDSLNAKLQNAMKNQPKERRALALANSTIKAKIKDYPYLQDKAYKKDLAKVKRIALDDARLAVGASGKKSRIDITDDEWEAIQSGAIHDTRLRDILRYADQDRVNALAMPRSTTTVSPAKAAKINAMQASGYTIAEIAEATGFSTSTVSKYLRG